MSAASQPMRGFPPAPSDQVTLANWRTAPYSKWAFSNVRQLLPTAPITAGGPTSPLVHDLRDLRRIAFETPSGTETFVARALAETQTDGMVVLHRGRVAFEWYDNGLDARSQHLVFSVSKSILGALTGILVDRGLVDPAAPVTRYLPEMEGSAYGGGCTVQHVLDMSVGIDFAENYEDPQGDVARYRAASGWDPVPAGQPCSGIRAFLPSLRPNGNPHGHAFHYVSPNTDVAGWVLERATGTPFARLLGERLWGPMGAEAEANMALDPFGMGRFAGGISASVRDIARVGELMRNRGVAGGRAVVPGWWVDDIRTRGDAAAWARGDLVKVFPTASYRNKWYNIAPGVVCAVGIHGQWIYVDEAAEVVVARVSSQPKAMELDKDLLWRCGFDAIARHLAR